MLLASAPLKGSRAPARAVNDHLDALALVVRKFAPLEILPAGTGTCDDDLRADLQVSSLVLGGVLYGASKVAIDDAVRTRNFVRRHILPQGRFLAVRVRTINPDVSALCRLISKWTLLRKWGDAPPLRGCQGSVLH